MTVGLKARAVRASILSVSGKLAGQAFRLASNLIMTRLLAPDMFGVMATGFVFLTAVQMFSDVGLRQVIIKSTRGNEPDFLNTVWTLQIVRGAVLFLVCLGVAGILWLMAGAGWLPAGSTYAHPQLPIVLALLSTTALIIGFDTTKRMSANRRLMLGRTVLIDLLAQVLAFVPMVAWAMFDPTVYALTCGALTSSVLQVLFGHLWLPGQSNRLRWERSAVSEVQRFGQWIMVTSGLGFVMRLGDRAILSALLSAPVMGMYSIACIMVGVPQHLAESLIHTVALPVLSEIQRSDPRRLKSIYYRIRLPVDALCLVSGAAIFICASTIIDILYDDRYALAGPMLQALSAMLFTARFAVASQFYLVLDRPKLTAQLQFIRLICMILFIPGGYHFWGMQGAVWGVALSPLPEALISVFIVKRRLGLVDYRKEAISLGFLFPGLAIGWGINALAAWLGLVSAT
jgi:O-antigen/teichoic acid export membrane protein